MGKSYRRINIFVSHPFKPNTDAFTVVEFRKEIKSLIDKATKIVEKEFQDFKIDTTFVFNDSFETLPKQIENNIRSSHLGIVDISENKSNIFYEYGLLYGLNIPIILIKRTDSFSDFPIPADLKDRLPHSYDNFKALKTSCIEDLVIFIKKLITSESLYNIHLPKIWFPNDVGHIQIVTSTESERREQFAVPEADNYMLLESLGDKDSLLAVVTFLERNYRKIETSMYAADSAINIDGNLVVIGGPGDDEGDGNQVCKTFMTRMDVKVTYSEDCEQLLFGNEVFEAIKQGNKTVKDYGYFARFPNPFNPTTSVILIHGIHTFGVLGAAKAFSDHPTAQGNIKKVLDKFKLDDFKQASFECFFPVEVLQQTVVCPELIDEYLLPLSKKQS